MVWPAFDGVMQTSSGDVYEQIKSTYSSFVDPDPDDDSEPAGSLSYANDYAQAAGTTVDASHNDSKEEVAVISGLSSHAPTLTFDIPAAGQQMQSQQAIHETRVYEHAGGVQISRMKEHFF